MRNRAAEEMDEAAREAREIERMRAEAAKRRRLADLFPSAHDEYIADAVELERAADERERTGRH